MNSTIAARRPGRRSALAAGLLTAALRWEVTGEGTDGCTGAGVTLTWADGRSTGLVVEVTRNERINRIGIGGPEGS